MKEKPIKFNRTQQKYIIHKKKKERKQEAWKLTMLFAFGCDDIGHLMKIFSRVRIHIMYIAIVIIIIIFFTIYEMRFSVWELVVNAIENSLFDSFLHAKLHTLRRRLSATRRGVARPLTETMKALQNIVNRMQCNWDLATKLTVIFLFGKINFVR